MEASFTANQRSQRARTSQDKGQLSGGLLQVTLFGADAGLLGGGLFPQYWSALGPPPPRPVQHRDTYSWGWNNQLVLSAAAQAPFLPVDLSLPQQRRWPGERSWIQGLELLAGQDAALFGGGQFAQNSITTDLAPPRIPPPRDHRSWEWNNAIIQGQDAGLFGGGLFPQFQGRDDLPRARPWPYERTWVWGTLILVGQDIVYGAPGQAPAIDLGRPPTRVQYRDGYIQGQIPDLLNPVTSPFISSDQSLPFRLRAKDISFVQGLIPDLLNPPSGAPFIPSDQSLPFRQRARDVSFIQGSLPDLFNPPPTRPENIYDLSLPPKAERVRQPIDSRSWIQNSPATLVIPVSVLSFTIFGVEITTGIETFHILGQATPPIAALSSIYTVPIAGQAVLSTIVACNRSSSPVTYRLAVAVAGAADSVSQYVTYDYTIAANDTNYWTLGITLGGGDVIRVRAAT